MPRLEGLHPHTHCPSGEGKELVVHVSLHLLLFIHGRPLLVAELVDGGQKQVQITVEEL